MNDEMSYQSPGPAGDDVDLDRVWVNVAAEVWLIRGGWSAPRRGCCDRPAWPERC